MGRFCFWKPIREEPHRRPTSSWRATNVLHVSVSENSSQSGRLSGAHSPAPVLKEHEEERAVLEPQRGRDAARPSRGAVEVETLQPKVELNQLLQVKGQRSHRHRRVNNLKYHHFSLKLPFNSFSPPVSIMHPLTTDLNNRRATHIQFITIDHFSLESRQK
ncbi:hypothetical protein AOLI_G00211290 [Acnodon oligacanthus]